MNEKIIFRCRCFLIIGIVLICGAIAFFAFGGNRLGQSRVVWDSQRDAKLSRQAGLVTEFVDGITDGLGSLHESIGAIKGELGGGAADLRGLAIRLQSIAGVVETMENDLDYLRGRVGEFVSDFSFDDGSELVPENILKENEK